MACIEEVPLFNNRIDKERVSLSVRSAKFATLSGLQQANRQLLGNLDEKLDKSREADLRDLAVEFWTRLTSLVEPWARIESGQTNPSEARQQFVSSYALSLWALGEAGSSAIKADESGGEAWQVAVKGLDQVDWSKTNKDWQGICMTGTEIVTRAPTRRATAEFIKWKLGLVAERPSSVLDGE